MADPDPTETQPHEKLPLLPKRKKFLIPVILLLTLTMLGAIAGVLIGFSSIKRSDAFKATLAELEAQPAVRQHVGTPVDPGWLVIGKHDDREGIYDLTFTINGPNGRAAVRSRCQQEFEGGPWEVTFLDIGVGGREGQVITLVGDPDHPPGSRD